MNSSPGRILGVTAGLLVAGALLGSIAAATGAAIAVTLTDGATEGFSRVVIGFAAIVGGILGAPLLPATSWLLLRRVPLGLSFVGTTVGTVLGGVLGWVLGGGISNPLYWPVGGAVIGFFAAVIVLRARFSTRGEAARPVSRVAV